MKRIISLLVSLVLALSLFFANSSVFAFELGVNNGVTYPKIELPFIPGDSAIDTTKPVIYFTDSTNKRVYSVNYVTGAISYLSFDTAPSFIYYANNEVYVTLPVREYSVPWNNGQRSEIAIINTDNFILVDQLYMTMYYPKDIVVRDGYIYVSSSSDPPVRSFSRLTKTLVSSTSTFYHASCLFFHPTLNRIYSVDTDLSPRDIKTFIFNNGVFTDIYDSPYHGNYNMGTNISISPDGKYLFTSVGTIFTCNEIKSSDMNYVGKISQSYTDIAFNINNNALYIANTQSIVQYNYDDFSEGSSISSDGILKNIFYNQDINKLITIYSKTDISSTKYFLETVDPPKTPVTILMDKIDNLPDTATIADKIAVMEARALYESLTNYKKSLITNYNKLVNVEEQLTPLLNAEVQQVINLIQGLPSNLTAQDRAIVENIRNAYDLLLETQKLLVTNYNLLLVAEKRLADIIGYPQIQLPFTPTDSARDTTKPIIYFTDKTNKRVYSVNYVTGAMSYLTFDLMPESIYYYKNEIYVSLMTREHSWNWENQSGAIAIINTFDFTLKDQFNITLDPFDIVAGYGFIYVSGGSNQSTFLNCYSRASKSMVSSTGILYQKSSIELHPSYNRVYAIETELSSRSLYTYSYNNGEMTLKGGGLSPGINYGSGSYIKISPDGKYLFTNAGVILACSQTSNDLANVRRLNEGYNDIVFGLNNDAFYVANGQSIIQYNYNDFSQGITIAMQGQVNKLIYNQDYDKLITVCTKTVNNVLSYYIETVDPPKSPETIVKGKIDILPATIKLADKQAILDARTAYDLLAEYKKPLVTNYSKLLMAETTIKPLLEAEVVSVIDFINTIPSNITINDKTKIENVRKSYDALLESQKAFVTNYNLLLMAENTLYAITGYPNIQLSFTPADSVMDATKSVIYLTDKTNKRVYSVNYATGAIAYLSFSLMPESIYYYNNEVYVSLMTGEHNYGWIDGQSGAIAIINANNFTLTDQFDIKLDPYDIVVGNGYIYVTSGSGQWTKINSYSRSKKTLISSATIYQQNNIGLHPTLNTIYAYNPNVSGSNMNAYPFNNGVFADKYGPSYSGGYSIGTKLAISPDGKYLFTSDGIILTCNGIKNEDMAYVNKLNKGYNDIAFDIDTDTFYTGDSQSIVRYNYNSLASTTIMVSPGNIKNLYLNSNKNKLITVYSKTVNSIQSFYIQAVDPPKKAEVDVTEKIDALPSTITINNIQNVIIARKAYNVLTELQKALITNYDKLLVAEDIIAQLEVDNYDFDPRTGTILGYYGEAATLIIPLHIGGISVKIIGAGAFSFNTSIQEVIIPTSVTVIQNDAFSDSSLMSITIPNSVTEIQDSAFAYTLLSSISIPNSVTKVGIGILLETGITSPVIIENGKTLIYVPKTYASYIIPNTVTNIVGLSFYMCSVLYSVTIPSSVTAIGDFAFMGCSYLGYISIPNTVTTLGNGILFGTGISHPVIVQNGKTLIYVPMNYTSYTIPSGVTIIGGMAFYMNDNITSVNIPETVTSIGYNAFLSCGNLSSINIPSSVTYVGSAAFSATNIPSPLFINGGKTLIYVPVSYTSYNIPNTVTKINEGALFGCIDLLSVYIPSSVTSIGKEAFYGCNFESVTIPNGVTIIEDYTFAFCSSLKSVTIPYSVTSIGEGAFYYCEAFTNVVIPPSVTTIHIGAFSDCTELSSITIPNTVIDIGDWAFDNCPGLSIYGAVSSYAQQYAFSYGIPFVAIALLSAPTGIASPSKTNTTINLSWSLVTGSMGYNIYINGEKVNQSLIISNTYTVTGLDQNTAYNFSVKAINSAGESAGSTVFNIKTNSAVMFNNYKVTGEIITNIQPGLTVDSFLSKITIGNETVLIFTNGTVLNGSNKLGTGTTIEVFFRGAKINTYSIVIYGDVNGDSTVNLSDLTVMRDCLLEKSPLEGEYKQAGDLYSEGNITLNGLVGMMAYISESGSINQNLYVAFTNNKLTGSIITNIQLGTTVESFFSGIIKDNNVTLEFTKGVTVLNGSDIIGTGTRINVYVNGVKKITYTMVIYGDVSGDGEIKLNDLTMIRDHILDVRTLENEYKLAGDLYGEGDITLNDLVGMMAYISEGSNISQTI